MGCHAGQSGKAPERSRAWVVSQRMEFAWQLGVGEEHSR